MAKMGRQHQDDILKEILKFFKKIFEMKTTPDGYKYAEYQEVWLKEIGLSHKSADEAKSAQTAKKLQVSLKRKFGERIKTEAHVAEGMTLRFDDSRGKAPVVINSNKLQAFDILDLENGVAFEVSLADAYAEFFKDVLKALLDARVKKLYICMRNHSYKNAKKSGYIKVASSEMVCQYIELCRLYKLEIELIDLYDECNKTGKV